MDNIGQVKSFDVHDPEYCEFEYLLYERVDLSQIHPLYESCAYFFQILKHFPSGLKKALHANIIHFLVARKLDKSESRRNSIRQRKLRAFQSARMKYVSVQYETNVMKQIA